MVNNTLTKQRITALRQQRAAELNLRRQRYAFPAHPASLISLNPNNANTRPS